MWVNVPVLVQLPPTLISPLALLPRVNVPLFKTLPLTVKALADGVLTAEPLSIRQTAVQTVGLQEVAKSPENRQEIKTQLGYKTPIVKNWAKPNKQEGGNRPLFF